MAKVRANALKRCGCEWISSIRKGGINYEGWSKKISSMGKSKTRDKKSKFHNKINLMK